MAIKLKGLENIRKAIEQSKGEAFTNNDLKAMGESVVKDMKDSISKGISPIRGRGRFPAYKDPSKYPRNQLKNYPDKRARPVNLHLSGDFLNSLYSKGHVGSNPKIEIGYSSSEAIKEQGHRDGANGQPKRPTLPQGTEKFNVTIEKNVIDLATKAVRKYFKKKLD